MKGVSTRRIARMAGISASAVSLALAGSPRISEATTRRVRRLAARLNYRTNPRVTELMAAVRARRSPAPRACFGLISLYPDPRPWEAIPHLGFIHAGMERRAAQLGYRLEPFWLREPGMTFRRMRSVLDVRGIEGLVCFGGPDPDEAFPSELDHYAVVTVGLSLRTPMNRVTSHFYNDMLTALERVLALGYRRPGLVLGDYEEQRCRHVHAAVYFGCCDRMLPGRRPLPVLRVDGPGDPAFGRWYRRQRPDVIIFAHRHAILMQFAQWFRERAIAIPGEVGVAALSDHLEGTGFAGLRQNQTLMGEWAVELLASRTLHHDLSLPAHPRTEMVESYWVDSPSLRPAPRPSLSSANRRDLLLTDPR
jgi:LacI family transcriptional regulator